MPKPKSPRRLQIETMKRGKTIQVEDKKQDQNIITALGRKKMIYCIVDGAKICRVK